MANESLLLIISLICFACLFLEQRVAWLAHVSGVCLIIMVALALSSLGLIPVEHPLYDFFTGPTIPIALALMVLSLDFREVLKIPKSLAFIYVVGVLGSIIATLISVVVVGKTMGMDAALLAAQFSASYIGGGENAVAMQKIFNIPNELFVAGFAVDNLLTSLWMIATLVFARSKPKEIAAAKETRLESHGRANVMDLLFSIFIALGAHGIAKVLSVTVGHLHPILYLSLVAFLLGQIPLIRERLTSSYLLGTLLFAPFFFSIGAISSLRALTQVSWMVILMPTIIVGVHGLIIYGVGYLCKIPSLETSLASQAMIGGPSTAVALAQAKGWRTGVSLGLITGITGYAIANYCGAAVYYMSIWILERL